jgi:hypothetical protein
MAEASEEIIERTERGLGVSFPAAHRARLASDNGGSISVSGSPPDETWTMYPVSDTTNSRDMQRTAESISLQTSLVRFDEWFPSGAVVVGKSSTGDLLLLRPPESYERWSARAGSGQPVTVTWESAVPAAPAAPAPAPPAPAQ